MQQVTGAIIIVDTIIIRMNVGFLASRNGSNMQAIIDACKSGLLEATRVVVISNKRLLRLAFTPVRKQTFYRTPHPVKLQAGR